MSTHYFEDADHVSDKVTRISKIGILIFCNREPVMWLSKKHNLVKMPTFISKFTALKFAVELVIALLYMLRMLRVPIEGPTNILW